MIYVYAITDSTEAPIEVEGMEHQPVVLNATADGMAAAITRHDASRLIPVTADNVLQHERVIEQLMSAGHSVLPARFGTRFDRQQALDDVLHRNASRIRAALDHVRSCQEWGVRVMWHRRVVQPPHEALPALATAVSTGRDFMLKRADQERTRAAHEANVRARADELHETLSAVALDSSIRVLTSPQLLFSGAYLVGRDRTADFHHRVRELTAAYPDLRILGTGPWPPYHFTPALA